PPDSRSGRNMMLLPFSSAKTIFHSRAPAESLVQLSNWLTPSWNKYNNISWTLSLHFRTNQSKGLIFYADELHSQSYFQVSLVNNGQLELRIQLVFEKTFQRHHL